MNEGLIKLKSWWQTLALREQTYIKYGSIVVLILFIYFAIWSPLLNGVNQLRERILHHQKTLIWMRAADKVLLQLSRQQQGESVKLTPITLLARLQNEITAHGLDNALTQLKQTSHDSIDMHFQKVDFDKLSELLISVGKLSGVQITQAAVVAVKQEALGLVNADFTLGVQ